MLSAIVIGNHIRFLGYNNTSHFALAFFYNRLCFYQSFILCSTLSSIASTIVSIAASAIRCWTRFFFNLPEEQRLQVFLQW